HLLRVCRYVERNPLRAGLVRQVQTWGWGRLWHRVHGRGERLVAAGAGAVAATWGGGVKGVESEAELAALRRSVLRGTPYGEAAWQQRTAARLGLEATLRGRGRPRKARAEA